MSIKIESKIVAYNVVKPEDESPVIAPERTEVISFLDMNIPKRPKEALEGYTYSIEDPTNPDSNPVYITINFLKMKDGKYRLFEIFFNSMDFDHLQWVVLTTRLCSALFRRTGRIRFVIDEMLRIPNGRNGYMTKLLASDQKARHFNSEVAQIGCAIEHACKTVGVLDHDGFVSDQHEVNQPESDDNAKQSDIDPAMQGHAKQCKKCSQYTVIRLDNCDTCLECGDAKCG